MESRLRASREQFLIMIDFMETNGDLSRPQPGAQGRQRMETQWNELTELLNSTGAGVQKQADKWKRVWSDWKTKTKRKASLMNRDTNSTGGGPSTIKALTPLEERVLRIMGLRSVTGHQEVQEAGFESTEPASDHMLSSTQPQPAEEVIEVLASATPVLELCRDPEPCNMELLNVASTSQGVCDLSNTERQREVVSPRVPCTPRRRRIFGQRRRHHQTPFEQAADRFSQIEEGRLRLEEKRVQMEHDRELERLRVESQRILVEQQRNEILERIVVLGTNILEILSQSQRIDDV
ncbi:uncharacterized protein [Epargyreus clarus]|uniref:uncharacterized protein n=1 Tax=Epargyreus clarus TaxID=520877 RepID=UPI003C2D4BD5